MRVWLCCYMHACVHLRRQAHTPFGRPPRSSVNWLAAQTPFVLLCSSRHTAGQQTPPAAAGRPSVARFVLCAGVTQVCLLVRAYSPCCDGGPSCATPAAAGLLVGCMPAAARGRRVATCCCCSLASAVQACWCCWVVDGLCDWIALVRWNAGLVCAAERFVELGAVQTAAAVVAQRDRLDLVRVVSSGCENECKQRVIGQLGTVCSCRSKLRVQSELIIISIRRIQAVPIHK